MLLKNPFHHVVLIKHRASDVARRALANKSAAVKIGSSEIAEARFRFTTEAAGGSFSGTFLFPVGFTFRSWFFKEGRHG
jgi:hypothetical protein